MTPRWVGRRSSRAVAAHVPVARALLAAAFVLLPRLAFAHVVTGAAAGFGAGLLHPISGLDHVAAMVAVGLWGAQLGRPALWVLPVAFPMTMAMGGLLGLLGVPLPFAEVGVAASAIALGLAVVLQVALPLRIATLVVGIFAVFHGYAHGTELPAGANALTYSMGFVIATGCLHGLGIGVGLLHRWPGGRLAIRAAGVSVVLVGALYLWRAGG